VKGSRGLAMERVIEALNRSSRKRLS
jgi:hypothetical protein